MFNDRNNEINVAPPHAPPKALGNRLGNCVACRKDPGLRYRHSEGNVLCWSCWERVEHLDHPAADVIAACLAFRWDGGESISGAEHDELVALGFGGADD